MDKVNSTAGILLLLAGVTGLYYGAVINLRGMIARGGAQDFSFITAYMIEWSLILIAGLILAISGLRRKT